MVTMVMVWNTCYHMVATVRRDNTIYYTQGTHWWISASTLGIKSSDICYRITVDFFPPVGCVVGAVMHQV